MASDNSEAGQEQQAPDLERPAQHLLAVALAARQKMRAESHSAADLPPLPSPSKATYTEQEIDFEVPAYIKSLIRGQAGGAGRLEEDSPLADDPSACSSSAEEDGDFEHATMDKATDASNATLIDKAWDL
ncbi:hypothetical protein RHOSPDRAFT_27812, partial [Rhodotorula sp. JG-1b]